MVKVLGHRHRVIVADNIVVLLVLVHVCSGRIKYYFGRKTGKTTEKMCIARLKL